MAAGQTIEKLFLSLGLDMAQLDTDLITAGKTVNQGMADLTRKGQQSKLKMDIDLSRFPDAERSIEALIIKEKALAAQHEIQKQKVALMNAAYNESVQAKGKDDIASQKLLTRLLREQKAEADLAVQIRQTNSTRPGLASGGTPNINTGATNAASVALNSLSGSFNRVRTAGQSAGNGIMAVNTKILALTAIAASGAGLFNLVKGAVEAGDAAYKLSSRLNLTAAESGNLNRMLKLSDVDSQSFISTMIRLDKSVTTAGKNGNNTTEAMKLFGISLLDAGGSLLPMNQQLEQLARGYKNAAQAGEEEAYVSEILGARGAALVPILRDYAVNAEAASRVKTIGIDPKQAHDLAIEMKVLSLEAGQMQNVLGMALMPIAKEIIPTVISGFDTMISGIKENKDAISDTVNIGVELIGTIKDISVEILKIPKFAFDIVGIHSAKDALDEFKVEIQELKNHNILDIALNNQLNSIPALTGLIPDYKADAAAQIAAEKEVISAKKATQVEVNKIADENKRIVQDQAAAVVQIQKKSMEAAKANAKAKLELDDEVYRANHSQLEMELHDIDVKKEKMITESVNESVAVEIAEARKKIIIDKNNKEIEKSTEQLNDAIYSLNHSALEIRLRDIDKERQEWIKKTGDEVKATQFAEQQKQKATRDAALSAIQGHKDELKNIVDMQKAIANAQGVKIVVDGVDKSGEMQAQLIHQAQNKAADQLLMLKKKSLGIDFDITPETMQLFESMTKMAEDRLLPGFETLGGQAGQSFAKSAQAAIDKTLTVNTNQSSQQVAQAVNNVNIPAGKNNAQASNNNAINLNLTSSVEFKGFTSDEINRAVERAKDVFGQELLSALQDANTQYGM
jgi:hypothetical protein